MGLKMIGNLLFGFVFLLNVIQIAHADEIHPLIQESAEFIKFVANDESECLISDGKLILIQNTNPNQSYEVWLDRWFMGIQTPDHTKQILPANSAPLALGCSVARSGGNQHWTIYSIKEI